MFESNPILARMLCTGMSPADAMYAEAHGTGTSLGDPIEIVAMGRALRGRGAHNDPQLGNLRLCRNRAIMHKAFGI